MTSELLPKAVACEQLTEALHRSGLLGNGRVSDVAVVSSRTPYPRQSFGCGCHTMLPDPILHARSSSKTGHPERAGDGPSEGTGRSHFIPRSGPLCGSVSSRAASKGVPMCGRRPGTCCSRTSMNPTSSLPRGRYRRRWSNAPALWRRQAYLDRLPGKVQRFFPVPKGSRVEAFNIWRQFTRSSSCSQWTRPHTAPNPLRDDNTSRSPESGRHPSAIVCSRSCNKAQLRFMTKSRHGCGRVW